MPSARKKASRTRNHNAINADKETGRLEAFSDGVFAVAITLLVLDIHVPAFDKLLPGGLGPTLLAQWPMLLAYVTSFMMILVMWINHHKIFAHIKRIDHGLMLYNGLLLMVVTLFPFPTALLAEYLQHPGAKLAVAVYSGCNILLALCFNRLWRHAAGQERLLSPTYDRKRVQQITEQYRLGPLLFATAFALGFIHIAAGIGMDLALVLFFALPGKSSELDEINDTEGESAGR